MEEQGPAFDITVAMPVYNREAMLPAAVAGVHAQDTTAKIEVIAVDDHSSDRSAEVLARLGVRTIRHPENRGAGATRNTAIEAARGRWTAFLDSDDRWAPDHLQTLWAARAGANLVAASALTISNGRLRVVGSPFARRVELTRPADVLRPENIVTTSACMVRTAKARAVGGFPASRYSEDLELWMRLLADGPGRVLPRISVAYRSHDMQITKSPESPALADFQLREAEARGWLPPATSGAIGITQQWDDRRRAGLSALEAVGQAPVLSWPALGVMLWRRAERRHRWRLQHHRARAVAALLSDEAD